MDALQHLNPIPGHEQEVFAALPARARMQLESILARLDELVGAKSLLAACRSLSSQIGLTESQLYGRLRNYKASGDWRDLVDKAAAGPAFWQSTEIIGLPAAFIQFWKGLCERHQRNNAGGYRELLTIWRTHSDSGDGIRPPRYYASIPGYDEWPKAGRYGYPAGWSLRNLSRHTPDLYDSAATRQGPFAAALFRPPVIKTRVGLAVLERIQFDDHEYNVKVHFPGQSKAMRPRGFTAADQLTSKFWASYKPTLWDAEDDVKKALTEKDAMWFVIYLLTTLGYRTDDKGTWLVVEKGTMAVKAAFAERILRATNGRVKVSEPGMFSKASVDGKFAPRAKGNFKHKALVEGAFNLTDNYFDGLAGQVGLSRIAAPEEMHGREHYLQTLLKDAARAPQEKSEKLILPVMTWAAFMNKATELYDAINSTPDHELEGWAELGFHDLQWRIELPDGTLTSWQSTRALADLPEPQRMAIQTMTGMDTTGKLTRAANLSRGQAFDLEFNRDKAAGKISVISPWRYNDLMGLDNGYEVTVGKHSLITIESREFGVKPLHYLAAINGNHLPVGEKFLAFINPWNPRVGLLCKANGAAVGLMEMWDVVAANDIDAQKRMAGKQGHWQAERRALLDARHTDEAANLEHMRAHNEAVLGPDAETKAQAEAQAKTQAALDRGAKRCEDDFSALDCGPTPAPQQVGDVTMEELNQL